MNARRPPGADELRHRPQQRTERGQTGTTRKFKYGPLGNTVNLASRVQGASKHLKTRLLIAGSVHDAVGQEFAFRRLGRVRVVNIAEAVELYELAVPSQPGWVELKQDYETALAHFEAASSARRPHPGQAGHRARPRRAVAGAHGTRGQLHGGSGGVQRAVGTFGQVRRELNRCRYWSWTSAAITSSSW